MIKEVSKIADMAIEFCRNNLDILMIAGVILIVAIIFISVVRSRMYEDDDDLDFDETLFKSESETKATAKTQVVEMKKTEVEPVQKEVPKEVELAEEPQVKQKESIEPQKPVITKNTSCIENILGELAVIPTDGVKEVEIKIQGAEVKITYANHDSLQLIAKELKDSQEEALEKPVAQVEEAEGLREEEMEQEPEDEVPQEETSLEKKASKEDEGRTIKKFGPSNNNVTRSGRVYSEEELQKQIRD